MSGREGNGAELNAAAERIEALVGEAERLPDERTRVLVGRLLREILSLYGAGWQRMLELIEQHDPRLRHAVVKDGLLSHLLMLHDLHPIPLAARVARALDDVRPALQAHGGSVDMVGLEGERLRLRLTGSCHGCPSSALTLRTTVEAAVKRAAPELVCIEVEGMEPAPIALEVRP